MTLLTGGFDRPYVFGLSMALISKGVYLDVIGSDDVDASEMHARPSLHFLNFWGSSANTSLASRIMRVWIYYARLLRYAASAKPKVFHILWNNKFEFFDRTLLMLYYKLWGKKIVFTAHNVNAGKRDLNDSRLNRLTLRIQYGLADHIFIHTEKMRQELIQEFGVRKAKTSVIPFGINNSVPNTRLTPREAKHQLGLKDDEKTVLFFGAIRPYKGLEYLVAAFLQLAARHAGYRLVVAGERRKGSEKYWDEIALKIDGDVNGKRVMQCIRYIPDEQAELYFKAADVVVLPYTRIFQSGVLFLAYGFGLPVIASDVGSLHEDIVPGETGFLCRPCDPVDLAKAIETYFGSDLYKTLDRRRQSIRDFANARNSWDVAGETTCKVYAQLLAQR